MFTSVEAAVETLSHEAPRQRFRLDGEEGVAFLGSPEGKVYLKLPGGLIGGAAHLSVRWRVLPSPHRPVDRTLEPFSTIDLTNRFFYPFASGDETPIWYIKCAGSLPTSVDLAHVCPNCFGYASVRTVGMELLLEQRLPTPPEQLSCPFCHAVLEV